MSRTFTEIKNAMLAAKATYSSLATLTSTSATAIWRNILDVVSLSIKTHEDLWDVAKVEMEERAAEIQPGILPWYAVESLEFQYGYDLIFNRTTKQIGYDVIDEDAKIVKLAAAELLNGQVTIKAAKLTSGVAEKLNTAELTSFTEYWIKKRIAGTPVSIISSDPDLIQIYLNIKYNPLILDNTGTLISDGATKPVEDAIDAFLQEFQAENFAGDMQVMKLIDAVQSAQGVLNVVATDIQAKKDGGTYSDILALPTQTYNSYAGYLKVDPSFPLSTTITYSV